MGFSLKGAISGALGGFSSTGSPLGGLIGAGIGGVSEGLDESQSNQAYKRQLNDNIMLWNMQNAYNSPVQQMQRLKAAGLNPMLVYGSGNVSGNASSGISAPTYTQSVDKGYTKLLQSLNIGNQKEDLAGKELDNEYKQLQVDILKSRLAILRSGRGVGNSVDADLKRQKMELQIRQLTDKLDNGDDFKPSSSWFTPSSSGYLGKLYMGGIYDLTTAALNRLFGRRTNGVFD